MRKRVPIYFDIDGDTDFDIEQKAQIVVDMVDGMAGIHNGTLPDIEDCRTLHPAEYGDTLK